MIEIIKRREGCSSEKQQIYGQPQISFNDWGHLTIRCIDSDTSDSLVVFSREATNRIVNYVNKYLNQNKQINLHVQNLKVEDIPF